MSYIRLDPVLGAKVHAQHGDPGQDLNAVAIELSEPLVSDDDASVWRLEVHAENVHSRSFLGAVETVPPGAPSPGAGLPRGPSAGGRYVAVAAMPGARVWHVFARKVAGSSARNRAAILRMATTVYPGCCGILPMNSSIVVAGGGDGGGLDEGASGVTDFDGFIAGGASARARGARVKMLSLVAGAGAATATFDAGFVPPVAGRVITVPAFQPFTLTPQKMVVNRAAVGTVTFAGVVQSAFVEWLL